ncbi:TIR domain-containing protein [Vibrio owensii]|uniref:TIR domain-containing protein n=1 Tax=Vibrio owensii TaxID=696485 RepID=UPI00039CE637|nr:nucleotide-binding protein [Vibrio owensii]
MNKENILEGLSSFRSRLHEEVLLSYQNRGERYGNERFSTWKRKLSNFLDEHLPGESSTLNSKLNHYVYPIRRHQSDAQWFWQIDGENMDAYLDSLILDIRNDEYDLPEEQVLESLPQETSVPSVEKPKNKVFIVHGHDGETKVRTARFIEKLGFEAIILHEQVSRGMTIIEKIEKFVNEVAFGIVLYTPDDVGTIKSEADSGMLKARARQNVVFEHGYLMGKLGRNNVVPLVENPIELPNDISGMVYVSDLDWQLDIAKEMKAAGYDVDLNKIFN